MGSTPNWQMGLADLLASADDATLTNGTLQLFRFDDLSHERLFGRSYAKLFAPFFNGALGLIRETDDSFRESPAASLGLHLVRQLVNTSATVLPRAAEIENIDPIRAWSKLFDEYPVLAIQFGRIYCGWTHAVRGLSTRLEADRAELVDVFGSGVDLGPVAALQVGRPERVETHAAQIILDFESGVRVVYKPVDHNFSARFADLLEFLNDTGGKPLLPIAQVCAHPDYAWRAFVPERPDNSVAARKARLHTAGAYQRLFELLGSRDLHYKNFISDGDALFAIDTEMMLSRRVPGAANQSGPSRGDYLRLFRSEFALGGFEAGYESMHRTCFEQREALVEPYGPLAKFAGTRARLLVRDQTLYEKLHRGILQPENLRDSAKRRAFLSDKLFLACQYSAFPPAIAAAELEMFDAGLNPSFRFDPGDTYLVADDGRYIPDVFSEPQLPIVLDRFSNLAVSPSADDLQQLAKFRSKTIAGTPFTEDA